MKLVIWLVGIDAETWIAYYFVAQFVIGNFV